MRLEFVCSGNLCRSPFAEGVAKAVGATGWIVGSSGICADPGTPCPSTALAAAARLGVDLSAHRSRRTSVEGLRGVDKVAVMEFSHLRVVRQLLPAQDGTEVMLLGSLVPGKGVEIPDPYGLSLARYLEVYGVISAAVRVWLGSGGPTGWDGP